MPLQLTSTSLKQEWQVHTNTHTHTPLALSRRYPVVSCISVVSSRSRASWKRNVCWSQRRNLCMTNVWLQIAAICQKLWWKNNNWHMRRIKPPVLPLCSTWAACWQESHRHSVCMCGDDGVPVKLIVVQFVQHFPGVFDCWTVFLQLYFPVHTHLSPHSLTSSQSGSCCVVGNTLCGA